MTQGKVKEGDLYRIITIAGIAFEIRYGYYSDGERKLWEPTPIFPDFLKQPQYTEDGYPFAIDAQDTCNHYEPKPKVSGENWCNDCIYFVKCAECIGLCKHEKRRRNKPRKNDGNAGNDRKACKSQACGNTPDILKQISEEATKP